MNVEAASTFIGEARRNVSEKTNETVIRNTFEQHLPAIVPDKPWWVRRHARGAESHTRFTRDGELRSGFVDTLVGATVIEYEADLKRSGCLAHAEDQLRDYAAGQINRDVQAHHIIAIASDTVVWRAYEVTLIEDTPAQGKIGRTHIMLVPVEDVDFSEPEDREGERLIKFLERHLARIGARKLDGNTLADDLGLGSKRSAELRALLDAIESKARSARPAYGDLIDQLWSELVDTIGGTASKNLGREEYLDEFYLMTLAKLICANVVDRNAPIRKDAELAQILDGRFFSRKGLKNYVEYDLFGWLGDAPAETGMLGVARAMQDDLAAYDFSRVSTEDLFGQLLARLGRRSTRLILGQELTPPWLAKRLVEKLGADLQGPLRLIDTACGSGTILVEAIRYERERSMATAKAETSKAKAERIAAAATGFDIDPVASLFAKTNWVIAMREELDILGDVNIPVFHADSLFAGQQSGASAPFVLKLDKDDVAPPASLLEPRGRAVFDHLLSNVHQVAMREAEKMGEPDTSIATDIARRAISESRETHAFDVEEVAEFARTLIIHLARLQKDGRNGLWTYVIRNTSRAAQATMQFNAMALNPPWLALSKIGDNPYSANLAGLAQSLGVRPAGQSFLHAEMSTIFLLEGVRRYLETGGRFGCIVPSTIAEGHHQNKFRTGAFKDAARAVDLDVDTIWRIAGGVFKNEALTIFGSKRPYETRSNISGREVGPSLDLELNYRAIIAEYPGGRNRTVWSPTSDKGKGNKTGFGYEPADFRQGADLMPRTMWFHDLEETASGDFSLKPIAAGSHLEYLIKEAKSHKNFRLSPIRVDKNFVASAVQSNHLTPFHLAAPARLLLPGGYDGNGWSPFAPNAINIAGGATRQAFDAIRNALELESDDDLFPIVNMMGKLKRQTWAKDCFIVLSGAGGANPCAAWIEAEALHPGEVVFDQTVYWAPVTTLREAAYLTGAINSPSCAELIEPFQPRGAQGKRHIHKLPFAVTPPFDEDLDIHRDVADATLDLNDAWRARLSTFPVERRLVEPSAGSLASRRGRIMAVIRELPEWEAYIRSTKALYGADSL